MINPQPATSVISPHAKAAMWHFVVVSIVGFLISTGLPALVTMITTAQLAVPASSGYGLALTLAIALVMAVLTFLKEHREALQDALDQLADVQWGATAPAGPVDYTGDPLAKQLNLVPDPNNPVRLAASPATPPAPPAATNAGPVNQ